MHHSSHLSLTSITLCSYHNGTLPRIIFFATKRQHLHHLVSGKMTTSSTIQPRSIQFPQITLPASTPHPDTLVHGIGPTQLAALRSHCLAARDNAYCKHLASPPHLIFVPLCPQDYLHPLNIRRTHKPQPTSLTHTPHTTQAHTPPSASAPPS